MTEYAICSSLCPTAFIQLRWCFFQSFSLATLRPTPVSAQTEHEASHMGSDVFRHSKKPSVINVCGELLFSSFILTSFITVSRRAG